MMRTTLEKTRHSLADLGVTRPEQVYQLFSELRTVFETEVFSAASTQDDSKLVDLHNKWVSGSHAILTEAWENWVEQSPAALQAPVRSVLSHLNQRFNLTLEVVRPLERIRAVSPGAIAKLFERVKEIFDRDILFDSNLIDLGVTRVSWVGRKNGLLTWITERWLKPAKPELKPLVGQALNELKAYVEAKLESRRVAIEAAADQTALAREHEDLSLPGVLRPLGSRHPLRQTFEEIERIFLSLGYTVVSGPEMETPYYNFEALNIPEHHPARDNMDTFYMATPPGAGPLLLRTHTSPMQIRTMEKQKPPVRIIVPGKVYRRDNPDATHGFMFQQIEGLAVDTDITFCDFKGTVEYFVREFLGPKVKTRLRPSYFPFTEPSVEVDATCVFCGGPGCSVCKQSGWIELFGAGMVDPAVYGFVNYDAKNLSGFAFGMGVERLTQLKYNINDVQLFFQNDVRFLRQFQ
jgi:phenylalanyl-tRNA synthetase alpha chain